MKSTLLGLAFVTLAVPAFAGATADEPASAQSAVDKAQQADPRWSTWLGCWELVNEDVRQGARAGAIPLQSLLEGRPRICVTPAPDGGARFETTVADRPAIEYTIVANGTDRPLSDNECRGTQRAEWSEDGLRVFARAELTCAGDRGPRRVSSLALIAPNGQWVDVQAVTLDGRESVRVRRYRRPAADASARIVPGSSLSLDDVKEASRKLSSLALEAALVETNAGYDLTSQKLVDLDTAGVPDTVIDLIVALSYPEKFVIERTSRATSSTSFISDPFALGWAFSSPIWYDDFYYSPYGYSRLGSVGPRSIFLVDGSGGAGSVEPQPSGTGRVVDGLGYTRVRPREPEAVVQNTSVRSRTSSVSSGDGGGSTSSSSGSSSSGSSGGATSGGGYTSGSSSGDTGRTAQPR